MDLLQAEIDHGRESINWIPQCSIMRRVSLVLRRINWWSEFKSLIKKFMDKEAHYTKSLWL
jgi:hypothetical protein